MKVSIGPLMRDMRSPRLTRDRTRIRGYACGWQMPSGTTDSDDVFAAHCADGRAFNEEGAMNQAKKPKRIEKAFNGVQVFSATMTAQRQALGETITAWIADARARRPGFQIVDIQVHQSSDSAYHCVTILLFFSDDLHVATKEEVP